MPNSIIKGGHLIITQEVNPPSHGSQGDIALHLSFEMQFSLNGHRALLLPDITAFTTSSGLMILCHRNNKNMTFNGDYSLCESIFGKLILQRTWECVVLVSVYLQCLCPDLALLHKFLRGDRWFESPNNDFSIQSFFFGRGFLSLNLIFVSKEIFQWLSPHPFFLHSLAFERQGQQKRYINFVPKCNSHV